LLKEEIGRLPDVAHPLPARKEQPMELSEPVKKILSFYESDNPGTKANLARILLQGKLGGTGRLLILPVDQGVEHGPARSFAPNPPAYDPPLPLSAGARRGAFGLCRTTRLSRSRGRHVCRADSDDLKAQ
jgi:hypothetical protein